MDDDQPTTERAFIADDDDLVRRARSDRDAFSLLYDRYYPRVSKYCLRRLFDRTIAEDVLSDIFLSVASHFRDFPGQTETEFRRWLFRIATNAINAFLRQTRRRQELWEAAACSLEAARSDRTATSPADGDALDWPVVYQAILNLDERDRSIVTLRFFSECSHDEIAEIVGLTPGAVRVALSRTLARLREKLAPRESSTHTPGSFPAG